MSIEVLVCLLPSSLLLRVSALGSFEKLVPSHVLALLMKPLEVMSLAQEGVLCLGEIPQRDLTSTILALSTGLVVDASFQVDLRIRRIHCFVTSRTLVDSAALGTESLHSFLDAGHVQSTSFPFLRFSL